MPKPFEPPSPPTPPGPSTPFKALRKLLQDAKKGIRETAGGIKELGEELKKGSKE